MRILVTLIFLAAAAGVKVHAQPASDAALEMVRSLDLGSNLPSMTYRMAMLTQTRAAMVVAVGPMKADELIRAEIAAVTPKYQAEWNRNLAAAWAPLMTAEEFRSLSQLKQASPFAQKYASVYGQAGASMRTASEALLAKVLGEVMDGAFAKSQGVK